MVSERGQYLVADITRMIKHQAPQTAVTMVMMTESRQSVVCRRTLPQFHASKSWKQDRESLQRLVIHVAQSTTTPAYTEVT